MIRGNARFNLKTPLNFFPISVFFGSIHQKMKKLNYCIELLVLHNKTYLHLSPPKFFITACHKMGAYPLTPTFTSALNDI